MAEERTLEVSSPGECMPCSNEATLSLSGQMGETQVPSSASDDRVKDEFSDLSEG